MATSETVSEAAFGSDLGRYRDQLEANLDRVRLLTQDLREEEFSRRPDPTRWSVSHCLDHLNKTARAYLATLGPDIQEACSKGLSDESPTRHGLFGGLFLKIIEPPPRVRVRAPKRFVPDGGLEKSAVLEEYVELRRQMAEQMSAAASLDLSRVRVRFGPAPILRFRLGTTFAVFLAHERRHIWQAENVLKELPG